MRRTRPRYPKPNEVVPVKVAIEALIPMDAPLEMGWRESSKLVPNFRLKSLTNEIEWCVDIYSGRFYVVSVHGVTEICKSIPSIVSYLCRMLGTRPKREGMDSV